MLCAKVTGILCHCGHNTKKMLGLPRRYAPRNQTVSQLSIRFENGK